MNEAQIEAGFKKHVQEVIDDGEHPDDVVSFPSFRAGIEFAKSVLSVSDGLEHSKASHHNRAEALLLAGYCRKNLLMLRARGRK